MVPWTSLFALLGSTLVLTGCGGGPAIENPPGYPSLPQGRAAAPAPTPGGPVPTPVGANQLPGGRESAEGEPQKGTAGAAAVGAVSGNSGIPQTMSGAGSASVGPAPEATPTPQPAATVTISQAGGFAPAHLTINRGEAVLWRNDDRPPQTVTGDPAFATRPGSAALPSGALPWGSAVLSTGDDYVQTFDVAGEYTYFSMPFERQGMVGRITVR